MGVGGNVDATVDVATDVIAIADVDDCDRGVLLFEKGREGFAGDLGEGGDV